MTRFLVLPLVLVLGACAAEEPANNPSQPGVQTAAASLDEGSLEAVGVLQWLNGPDATFERLDDEVGLYANSARNIALHVRGADGALGTRDDNLLDSVAELDAIPKVGPRAIERILAYVRSLGAIPAEVVEGVALTDEQILGILEVANHYSFEALDVAVGLDKRAATAIVERRPFGDTETLAAAPYVGRAAIRALRDRAELDRPGNEDIVIEGVAFTPPQAEQALEVANLATRTQLDEDAELDARAAGNIVQARPFTSLQEVAAVKYVGKSALAKIRDFVPRFTPPVEEDAGAPEGADCTETADCREGLHCGGIPFDGAPEIGKCIDGNLDLDGYWDECGRGYPACNDGLECIGTTAFGGEGWCAYPWMLGTYETRETAAIPDGDSDGVSMDVVVYGQASVPMDIMVTLYIDHPRPSDLVVTLASSNGSDSRLWNHDDSPDYYLPANGIERDNYINGTLTLHVVDTVTGQAGTLNGFKLLVSSRYD